MAPSYAQSIVLASGAVATLSAGTGYAFSLWSVQLASRLSLSSTSLNLAAAAGNAGVYMSGPFVGLVVDRAGPPACLLLAAVCLLLGYGTVSSIYDQGRDAGPYAAFGLAGLCAAQFVAGIGGSAALSASINGVAKSFGHARRASAIGVITSCFGLSAFFYAALARAPFLTNASSGDDGDDDYAGPGDSTSLFLRTLALGTCLSMLIGALGFLRSGAQLRRPPQARSSSTSSYGALASDPEHAHESHKPARGVAGELSSSSDDDDDDASSSDNESRSEDDAHEERPRRSRHARQTSPSGRATASGDSFGRARSRSLRSKQQGGGSPFGRIGSPFGSTRSRTRGVTGGSTARERMVSPYRPPASGPPAIFPAAGDEHQQMPLEDDEEIVNLRRHPRLSKQRRRQLREEQRARLHHVHQPELDISGKTLFYSVDFWLLFAIVSILSGVGLMCELLSRSAQKGGRRSLTHRRADINNVGTVIHALADPSIPEHRLAKDQGAIVSRLSLANAVGRLLMGFVSDAFNTHGVAGFTLARPWFLVPMASLFVVSQLVTLGTDHVEGFFGLSFPTVLVGLAYGSLFGLSPVLCLEWFGMPNFAFNNGLVVLSPTIGGNVFNLLFGTSALCATMSV